MMRQGKVWLVGAGPGDPGLFTIKGKYLIEHADVVVYDRLVGAGILSMIPPAVQTINVGKNAGCHPVGQEEINQILLREAQQGKRVVRLKGGDPFIFGRGGEELELLAKHGVPFEVVPGISAAAAVPAYAGIPVTHREYCSSLHIITAHRKRGDDSLPDFETLVKLHGTLVFFMGVSSLPEICAGLIRAGMAEQTPAAVIENGTTARQRNIVSDLKRLPERAVQAGVQSPALILVGEVCGLSSQFSWAEFRPLHGCRVLVTRPRERVSSLAEKLSALGAEVVLLPSISTKLLLEGNEALSNAIKSLPGYRWVVFTSAAGAEGFFKGLRRFGIDSRNLPFLQFAAIGPATAKAVLQFGGILCDYLPEEYTGKA
ncbi:MAG: uroporphyrinogen-III C-methyltransferase, partial [Clostridiales bacterium]|nr:uroporphyrinogen-III C-methyltransferase [Clostridiales bacterium]